MLVKICGIRDVETAVNAVSYGADFIGLVFAKSKRQISVEEGKIISNKLGSNAIKVGVFVNETIENLEAIAKKCKLDFLQLHGNETPEFCKKLSIPVIKAFSISSEADVDRLKEYEVAAYLVDSFSGGSGEKFDWKLLNNLQDNIRNRLILAGGLDIHNVVQAIKSVRPYAVDVSSSVETDGKKDLDKIKKFIKCCKAYK